ncbi:MULTISPECIES: autotransporter assembly complex protein TamA [Pacificibacter]|uniref:autotransporter assembly complex protein TamA n=1 Tax=Pacificibacter TaxID=1042323 RepID=UPI001C0A50BA|nr:MULTISPECIES: BamA/TamA family outer membrane protein [Pacificibacter]MBU2936532.1 BamA/TamA family outer membrane protein [Pacificibacter marinus]MDO6614666.1 BamA/TamA family outer membrane protein [Pacificibacter sp. 1_MG-2023]
MTLHTTLIAAALCATVSTPAFAFNARLEGDATETMRDRLSSASAILEAERDGTTEPSDIIAAVQSDYRTLLGTLYRSGYYAPVIRILVDGREGSRLSLITLPNSVEDIVISVNTGDKFTFKTATVAPLAPQTELPAGFSTGQTAKSGEIGAAKDSAIDAWRAASYPKAALSSQSIVADHNTKTLDVALGIAPGPRAVFGQLSFAGTKRVSQERLTEITGEIEGKAFNPETLETAAARLRKTGAFRSVAISEAETLNADGSLDVTATVTDAAPRRVGFGAEINSLEGGTLSAYFMHRNISGNADRLRFDAEVAGLGSDTGIDYTVSTTYRRPATTRPVLALVAEAELARIDEPSYLSTSATVSVSAEVTLSDTTYFIGGIGYRYSDVSDDLGDRTFSHFILPIEGARDSRNNALNPTSGTYFAAEIMPFIGFSGSATGGRLFADMRGYKGFGDDDRFVLAGRFMAGSIIGSDVTETPPDLLFYSGGGGTVRGQPYQSLDVDLDDDTSTGGASFIGLSTELRAGITDKISLVGFADVGGIGENATPDDEMSWHAGAGLGLRYDTGFGPIRLDIAAPISGSTGDGVQFYVGIGQAF